MDTAASQLVYRGWMPAIHSWTGRSEAVSGTLWVDPALGKVVAGLAVSLVLASGAVAQQKKADQGPVEKPDVTVQVAGLSCPFCAYGLEKKLKNLEGVTEVGVLLDEGEVQLKLEEGARLSEKAIQKATEKAGFKANKITFARESARAPESG